MKKINLILCAAVVALAGLMVSCKNETLPNDWKNVTNKNYGYLYNVTGTVTNTNINGTETAKNTTVTTDTLKGAFARLTWGESAVNQYNYDNYYSINVNGKADSASTYTPATGTAFSSKKDDVVINRYLGFMVMDGNTYLEVNNEWVKLPETAFANGNIGDESFTFTYSTGAIDNGYWSQAAKDAKNVSTSETTYSLTFKKIDAE